ncbi:hypothetical protein LJK88_08685 [Paenibacillus sp. P26]|nr:hypothetical protein LJK88_08685 [Paenibacillus sp. P26]
MIQQFRTVTWLKASLALFLSGSMALGAFAPAAHAGEAGVFVDSVAYFTLDQAALSSSTLQFSLRLHNGSGGSFDFNNYGVRVTDTDGRSFTAKLNEKKSSVVAAGEEQVFRFTSSVAASETANRLKVDIFRWDESQADFMSDLGESPVEPAVAQGQGSGSQLVLNMYQLDNTLAGDASVGIQLGRSYRVFHNNEWEIYSELTVRNLGSASLKLPSAPLYRLKDGGGLTYASTLTGGSGQSLFPGQSASLVLKNTGARGLDGKRPDGRVLYFEPRYGHGARKPECGGILDGRFPGLGTVLYRRRHGQTLLGGGEVRLQSAVGRPAYPDDRHPDQSRGYLRSLYRRCPRRMNSAGAGRP